MATIYDIAKKAGISPTTVSKVFNNYKDVSAKTKEKVLKIADELGYVPNLTARSLKTNKSYLIGVVFSEDVGIGLEHQFFSIVLESFRKAIGVYGYDTIFINKSVGDQKLGYLDHCKYRNVDGIFIITAHPDDLNFTKLVESDIKCVTTDILFENTPSVISDNIAGSKMAVEYFYERGHRKIAHLAGPLETLSANERHHGYIEAMNNIGLGFDENYVAISPLYEFKEAYDETIKFFSKFNDDNRPTAIYVAADLMAIAVIQALNSIGLSVPEDVSVIGFDDISLAEYSTPGLTTVKQDKVEIGRQVAEKLNSLINKKDEKISSERLAVSIVERQSVKNLNAD